MLGLFLEFVRFCDKGDGELCISKRLRGSWLRGTHPLAREFLRSNQARTRASLTKGATPRPRVLAFRRAACLPIVPPRAWQVAQ